MKTPKLFIHTILICVCAISTILFSCKENYEPDNTPDQLFRPVSFAADIDQTTITLSWVPIANSTYLLEYSKDSMLFTTELKSVNIEKTAEYILSDLYSKTRYSVRIKAISKDSTIKDSEFKAITFRTGDENIFYTLKAEDVTANSILIKWVKGKKVSHITLVTGTSEPQSFTISETESQIGQKLIPNLTESTLYTVTIYWNDMKRGIMNAKTKAIVNP